MTSRRAFGSTYRLQLNEFGFDAARDLVPFLSELGIETLYLSPITRARTGSTHGYDVTDPTVVDPSLGGRPALDALVAAVGDHGMTVLLDIVPNHMAASTDNPYFRDVLRFGQSSPFAPYFDIAWEEQNGRVMLPVLGGPLDEVVAAGDLTLETSSTGERELAYFEQRFPLDPATIVSNETVRELVDRQHYVLADWRRANQELNYRRFFDINELIGIRQEDPAVFTATHELIVDLLTDSNFAGVRVDHVDGLRDPAGYLESLRLALGDDPLIEIEKILERDEPLRSWPVDGTSGYEFAVAVTGLFVDPGGAAALAIDHANATGDPRTFHDRAIEAKRSVMRSRFPHLVTQIADRLGVVSAATRADLVDAIIELAVQLTVYRTYRRAPGPVDAADRDLLVAAKRAAQSSLAAPAAGVVAAIVAAFMAESPSDAVMDAMAHWQQLTPPATAKGVEDTAIYDPGQLLAVADVGSDPDRGAVSVSDFHRAMATRQQNWPRSMSTLSTHDSKRSHDVRCRLAVLSELATSWSAAVTAIEAAMTGAMSPEGPDATERRYLYETVIAVWPLDDCLDDDFVARVRDHMTKAGREAKRRSDWIDPDLAHEAAVGAFVEQLLRGADDSGRRALELVVREIEVAAATNALASVVIRAAAPGVPDVYQGDDTWFFALVDPDNRRPLDVMAHVNLLDALRDDPNGSDLDDLVSGWRDGRIKQYVVRRSLRARRDLGDFFTSASYEELVVTGRRRDHVAAFARRTPDRQVICVVPRLTRSLAEAGSFPIGERTWGDTAIVMNGVDGEAWVDRISGGTRTTADDAIAVGSLFESLPVALLERC
jgi:(1->4)-alpha-D-glucan 1-alpha-D-glucosylmutase